MHAGDAESEAHEHIHRRVQPSAAIGLLARLAEALVQTDEGGQQLLLASIQIAVDGRNQRGGESRLDDRIGRGRPQVGDGDVSSPVERLQPHVLCPRPRPNGRYIGQRRTRVCSQ